MRQPCERVGVLHRERQPVQRTDLLARGRRLVGDGRPGPGALLVEGDDRVELGVALVDPVEVQLEQLARRDLPGPYGGGLVAGGGVDRQVGHRRRPKIPPTTTPSTTSPAPTATPVRKSCCEPSRRRLGRGGEDRSGGRGRAGARPSRPRVRRPPRRPGRRRSRRRRCRRTPRPSASRPRSASAGRRRRPCRRRPRRRRRRPASRRPRAAKRTLTVAPMVPGAPAPSSFITSDSCSTRSESTQEPA